MYFVWRGSMKTLFSPLIEAEKKRSRGRWSSGKRSKEVGKEEGDEEKQKRKREQIWLLEGNDYISATVVISCCSK